MKLSHAVVTAVARDDLADGGAVAFAETITAIRRRSPGTTVEVLIPDCKGDEEALGVIFAARPDVLNHNLETVNRLQRAVRPSASYARSLSVLARSAAAGLTTKSGIILGMGETAAEVVAALGDLRAVGVNIVTLGQYLRPTAAHLPVARWWAPAEFDELADKARAMGISYVEASPLTRSSYHARRAIAPSTSSTPPSAAVAAPGVTVGTAPAPAPKRREPGRPGRLRRGRRSGASGPFLAGPGPHARNRGRGPAPLARGRPSLADRLRGDAARAPDDARAAGRRSGDPRRARARSPPRGA